MIDGCSKAEARDLRESAQLLSIRVCPPLPELRNLALSCSTDMVGGAQLQIV
jgi:hypothetical protein